MPATTAPTPSTTSEKTTESERPRRARKKKEARRWLREVEAITLFAVAGFAAVALFNHARGADPQGVVGALGD